jgi:hypothetical protein
MKPWTPGIGGVLLAVLPTAAAGEGPAINRSEAKVYRILGDTRRLPKLDAGDAERTLSIIGWRPLPRPADDPAATEPLPRRQILDATCDADLTVVARVESSVPFQHPNSRWVLTAHELVVSRVVRARTPRMRPPERIRYVHPSGELTLAGRAVRTTLTRFPVIASDEEGLFFLVRIGRDAYRTSLLVPPMAIRGGILDAFGAVPSGTAREAAAGLGAREAMHAADGAVCRPAPVDRRWRSPSTSDGRLPPLTPRLGPP